MHQHNFRDRRNRYLHQLATLRQLSEVTGVEMAELIPYLDRLRQTNQFKEALQETSTNTGDTTP